MINNIDINKIVVSNKIPFEKQNSKCFSGYKENKEIRHWCIFFLEISMHKRYQDETKCMYFMIKFEKILDKYMAIWDK